MQELTQAQYVDLFGFSNFHSGFEALILLYNAQYPQAPVKLCKRSNVPTPNQYPILYREQLPERLEQLLADAEAAGKVYTGGLWALSVERRVFRGQQGVI